MNEHPINVFQDEYQVLKERDDRRRKLRELGEESIANDVLWFRCLISVWLNDMGWDEPRKL